MSDRFERLTNLVATLLDTPRPLTVDDIIERVPGYPQEFESARRQFERDKDALRGLGIPIRVEDDVFGDQVGYRVDRHEYELPELDLTDDERAALHTAVTAVRLEGGEGREALWKLGGLEGEDAPALGALPNVPQLPALLDASRARSSVQFSYRGTRRTLDPYAVVFRRGNWYVMGFDHDREEIRSFRADRIDGAIETGPGGAFERPADFDPDAALHHEPWRYGDEPPIEATLKLDRVVAPWVLQRLGSDAPVGEDGDHVIATMVVTNREAFRTFVLGLLEHAEVLEPPELRSDVIAWLQALADEET